MSKLVTFEGIDGCGKTTQINLISNILKAKDVKHFVLREPGGTKISEKIRKILLDKHNDISSITETLLFLSARSQMVHEIIKPKLKKDKIILCDRFIDSTVAYQGYGHNLNVDIINSLNLFAIDEVMPNLTFFLDVDPIVAYERLNAKSLDRMELKGIDYLTKVREGYLNIVNLNPDRFKKIDCNNKDIISINNEIINIMQINLNKEV